MTNLLIKKGIKEKAYEGEKKVMKKRIISLCMAAFLALQPTAAVMAQSEEQSVIRGDGYTMRSHVDGSQTVTFYADLEDTDYPETEQDEAVMEPVFDPPQLDINISESGKGTEVSMECGDVGLSFVPEISENKDAPVLGKEKVTEETAVLEWKTQVRCGGSQIFQIRPEKHKKSGRQMSKRWIEEGEETSRLAKDVGPYKAQEISNEGYVSLLVEVDPSGKVTTKALDENGYVIKKGKKTSKKK